MATEKHPEALFSDSIVSSPLLLSQDDDQSVFNYLRLLQKGQRSQTMPRGCRFRDLGEAHRNITGRSISNSLSNSASPSCSLSSDSWKPLSSHDGSLSCSDDIALQDMTLPAQEPCSQKTADAVTAQETSREQPDTPDSLVKSVYPLYQTHLDMSVEEKEVQRPQRPQGPLGLLGLLKTTPTRRTSASRPQT